jgi:hypothetical protein
LPNTSVMLPRRTSSPSPSGTASVTRWPFTHVPF